MNSVLDEREHPIRSRRLARFLPGPAWIRNYDHSLFRYDMIDTTAVDSFEKTITGLRQQGIPLVVARANDEVRDMTDRTAVDAFQHRNKTD